MEKGVQRIYTAVVNKEKILVFGDFDADGVTATAIIFEFLCLVEADTTWYIPHRTKEGYSLHPPHHSCSRHERGPDHHRGLRNQFP